MTNLIVNGDFALYHHGSTLSGNPAIPDNWTGIQNQTVNARVLDGAMMFSTAHPTTNVNLYKDYIYQSFSVTSAGMHTLSFDYRLENPAMGKSSNGAMVYLDQFYSSAPGVVPVITPNLIFSQSYGTELLQFAGQAAGLNQWHLGETLTLDLAAGTHTLYLSSGSGDFINQYGARVWFDNVTLTSIPTVAAVPEPSSLAMLCAGLAALGTRMRRTRRQDTARAIQQNGAEPV